MTWRQMQLKGVPADLKAALVEEAMRRRTNVADVIVSGLADHYALEVDDNARRKVFRPSLPYGDSIVLRVPDALLPLLVEDQARHRTTRSGAALAILAARMGIQYDPPQRGKVAA